jgi:hypothetical protein
MTDLKLLARRAVSMTLGLALASVARQPAFGQVKTTVPDVRQDPIVRNGEAVT